MKLSRLIKKVKNRAIDFVVHMIPYQKQYRLTGQFAKITGDKGLFRSYSQMIMPIPVNLFEAISKERFNANFSYIHDTTIAMLRSQTEFLPNVDLALNYATGDWAITKELAQLLVSSVKHFQCRNILEFGAGSSSVVISAALSDLGGGKLTSIEQNPDWCLDKWKIVKETNVDVDACMIIGKPILTIGRLGLYYIFKDIAEKIKKRGPYDMVVIDAPQLFYGRDGALPLIFNHLSTDALIFLDDASRRGERWAIWRWLKVYPGLSLIYYDQSFGGKGLAILRLHKNKSPRTSIDSFFTGLIQLALRRYVNRNIKKWL